jgi:hypothetical protein
VGGFDLSALRRPEDVQVVPGSRVIHLAHPVQVQQGKRDPKDTETDLEHYHGADAVLVSDVHGGFFFERCKYKDTHMANYISTFGKAAIYTCFKATKKNARTSTE